MTYFRPVQDLVWARRAAVRGGGQGAAVGTSKARGLLFEQQVFDLLQPFNPIKGQWFAFRDIYGVRNCQVDILIERPKLVVVECKLNRYSYSKGQILSIYKPVVERTFNTPGLFIHVMNARGRSKANPVESFLEALDEAEAADDKYAVW